MHETSDIYVMIYLLILRAIMIPINKVHPKSKMRPLPNHLIHSNFLLYYYYYGLNHSK